MRKIGSTRAVLFDLDNTLCNTSASRLERARLVSEVLVAHSPSLIEEDLMTRILEPLPQTGDPRGARPLVRELGLSESETGRRAIGLWFFEGCEDLLVAYPGGEETIASLSRGYRLGVVTNGEDSVQRHKLAALGWDGYFQSFVSSGSAGHEKSESEIFQIALKDIGAEPHDSIFVGDNPAFDVLGAQLAGIRGVWFNPEGDPVPDGILPDATIRSFAELPGLIVRKNSLG